VQWPGMHRHVLCHTTHPGMVYDNDFRGQPGKAILDSNAEYVTHTFALEGMRMSNQQVYLKSGT